MCWAACDRLARIAGRLERPERADYWRKHAEEMREEIESRATAGPRAALASEDDAPYFAATFDGTESDASLLLLEQLGFVKADDPRYVATVDAVERDLRRGDYLYRYIVADDFGVPQTAFNICTFCSSTRSPRSAGSRGA